MHAEALGSSEGYDQTQIESVLQVVRVGGCDGTSESAEAQDKKLMSRIQPWEVPSSRQGSDWIPMAVQQQIVGMDIPRRKAKTDTWN